MHPRHLLFLFAALSPLRAAGPLDVLKLVPASAESVELTWKPAEATARYQAALSFLDKKDEMVDLGKIGHLSLQDLAPGPVAIAKFEVSAQPRKPKAKVERTEVSVGIFPLKDAKALLGRVKARKVGTQWTYEWAEAGKKEKRYLALKGEHAFISEDKATLEKALQPGLNLEAEGALLQDWMLRQDSVLLIPEKATLSLLTSTKDSEARPKAKVPMAGLLDELAAKARTSVHHVAIGLQLPSNGGMLLQARAFFKPGSTWAKEAGTHEAPSSHPLGLLPEGPFALAMGGEWPRALDVFNRMAMEGPWLSGEDRKVFGQMLDRNQAQVQRMAFVFRAPKPGEPFLQGFNSILEVKDAKVWMAASREHIAWIGERLKGAYALQPDCLPEVPSHTLQLDLAKLTASETPNPQLLFMGSMLFGGNQCRISYGQLDEHHVLCVVGNGEVLKGFLDQVRSQPQLTQRAAIQAVDAQLPKSANFAIYLDPLGLRDLVSLVMQGILGKPIDLPKAIIAVPPMAGAISMDAQGIQFSGFAPAESLQALVQLLDATKHSMDAAKQPGASEGEEASEEELEEE